MILYLACLPGALLSLSDLGEDHPEMNTLLFFRIDAWGPSWVQGKPFPGTTALTSAGACCSSHCQAQSLLHINLGLLPSLTKELLDSLTRLQWANTALAAWRRICSIWDVRVFVQSWRDGSCLHTFTLWFCTVVNTGTCCLRLSQLLPSFKENVFLPLFLSWKCSTVPEETVKSWAGLWTTYVIQV